MATADADNPFLPPLDNALHLRYWTRCIRTLLPHHYTSMDSSRMSLGFFILCAIDLLTPGAPSAAAKPTLTAADRIAIRQWVLACRHPGGGFTSSPTHTLPHGNGGGDANIAGTYFALLLLALVADPAAPNNALAGVDRRATLRWLRALQRPGDGSFGELVYGGRVCGGRDMRYCYLAAAVRWMLRAPDIDTDSDDIDVDALVAHIRRGQTYDGGFAEAGAHESHAGYAYCAVAALALLGRRPRSEGEGEMLRAGVPRMHAFVAFLASRQVVYEGEDDDDGADPRYIGFNGRCNKPADTCYTWWTLGALHATTTTNTTTTTTAAAAHRRFLLDKTQHAVAGGFGKHPGSPPDVGHGCLGLAALAAMGEPALKPLDAELCVSRDAVAALERARGALVAGERRWRRQGGVEEVGGYGLVGGRARPAWLDGLLKGGEGNARMRA